MFDIRTMNMIGEFEGNTGEELGSEWSLTELYVGYHNIIYLSSSATYPISVYYFEVISDFKAQDSIAYLSPLKLIETPETTATNYGQLHLSSAKEYTQLLMFFDRFNQVSGQTFCDFTTYVAGK